MSPAVPLSIYNTLDGHQAIMEWYDRQVDRCAVDPASRWVDTSAGNLSRSCPEAAAGALVPPRAAGRGSEGASAPEDAGLSALDAPVFVSYGAHDVFFPAERAVQQAEQFWDEQVMTEIVPSEGHLFSKEGELSLYNRVAIFLGNHEGVGRNPT